LFAHRVSFEAPPLAVALLGTTFDARSFVAFPKGSRLMAPLPPNPIQPLSAV
jgi:hypothetical protein